MSQVGTRGYGWSSVYFLPVVDDDENSVEVRITL